MTDIDPDLKEVIEEYLDSLHTGAWGRSFTITPGKNTRELAIDYIANLYMNLQDRLDALIGQQAGEHALALRGMGLPDRPSVQPLQGVTPNPRMYTGDE